ncbi:MAG: hypothetical protein QM718_09910 [Steroidobacteraceae bacterium]
MRAILLFTCLGLGACATSYVTRPYDATRDAAGIRGLRYYESQLYRVRYEYSLLLDKSGNVLGSAAGGNCRAVAQKEEYVILPDFSHPRVLLPKSGPLSDGRVGITLNNGMLSAVNLESSPQSASVLATLEKAVEAGVSLAAVAPGAGAACNAAPVIGAISVAALP